MKTEMALKIMEFCQDELHLEEGEAAQSMAMAAAMLSGNEHNILGLIKMMLETYEIMENENA
jgi:hypothetical protein